MAAIPTSSALRDPILHALRAHGGRASNEAVETHVAAALGLSPDDLAAPHNPKLGSRTEFAYRLAWARTSLKKDGLIQKVASRTWAIQDTGVPER